MTSTHTKTDYLIVLLLLCLSGNPAFTVNGRAEILLICFSFFLTCYFFSKKLWLLTPKFCGVCLFFVTILIVQSFYFNFFPLSTNLGFLIRLFIGYASFRLVPNFSKAYIEVMFYVCLLSMCFYIPDQLGRLMGFNIRTYFEPLHVLIGAEKNLNALLYNFQLEDHIHKNASFFWEPGAAAGYILLALVFLGLLNDKFPTQRYKFRLFIFCICLLTTFSTTGYLVLPIVLLMHYSYESASTRDAFNSFLTLYLIFVSLVGYGLYIEKFNFVGEKLVHQYSKAMMQEDNWETNRFGTLLSDLEYIRQRPLWGWGLHEDTRYVLSTDKDIGAAQGNGLTGFTVKFGVIALLFFFYFLWEGLLRISGGAKIKCSLAILAILMLLNGEPYLNYPLFLGLLFLV